jgi:hypothetical protein
MTIYNKDGSLYSSTGSLRMFDPSSPEHDLFNSWDEEAIKIAGTPLFYYEVFIQQNTVDPIYVEDRGKLWSPNPIALYCYYEPIKSKNDLTNFGIDAPDEMIFELNYRAALRAIGHPPKIGSRVFSPHLSENWVVIQRNLAQFKKWGAIRLELICQRFQESVTTGEGGVSSQAPLNSIDSTLQ